MDKLSKKILYQLKTEGIGASIAGMQRGIQLLELLIEEDPETAKKYFKGVAAACEHISGKMLGENFDPKTLKNIKIITPNKSDIKKDNIEESKVEKKNDFLDPDAPSAIPGLTRKEALADPLLAKHQKCVDAKALALINAEKSADPLMARHLASVGQSAEIKEQFKLPEDPIEAAAFVLEGIPDEPIRKDSYNDEEKLTGSAAVKQLSSTASTAESVL